MFQCDKIIWWLYCIKKDTKTADMEDEASRTEAQEDSRGR